MTAVDQAHAEAGTVIDMTSGWALFAVALVLLLVFAWCCRPRHRDDWVELARRDRHR